MPARPLRRRLGAITSTVVLVGALSGAALVATAPGVGAGPGTTLGPVDPTIADGNPGSLRDVVENQAMNGETVVLVAGATYEICEQLNIGQAITIEGNGATIRQTCEGRVIDIDDVVVSIVNTIVTGGNDVTGAGIRVYNGGLALVESTVTANSNVCGEGGGVKSDEGSWIDIIRSTISGNTSHQDSAIDMDDGGSLRIVNSTISGNTSTEDGAISLESEASATIVYSTIVNNVGEASTTCAGELTSDDDPEVAGISSEPANVSVSGNSQLQLFGTVIALAVGGPNCDASGTVVSAGYNFSDDATCELTEATDREDAGSPGLGALAANGGPTLTHLPAATSPLVDAIPVAACGAGDDLVQLTITTDQRGVTRPQGGGCEIGSVEVVSAAVITPTFTG